MTATAAIGAGVAPLLEVRNLETHLQVGDSALPAVNKVSFTLGEGETLGVVGESGCGKSMTALSILGLVPVPPGRIASGRVIRLEGRGSVEGVAGRRASRQCAATKSR